MTRFNAAVLDAEGLHLPSAPGRSRLEPRAPAGPYRTIGQLIELAEWTGCDQLWIHRSALAPALSLDAPGWETRGEPDSWWYVGWRKGERRYDVAIPHRNTGDGQWGCWERAGNGPELLRALAVFHDALEILPRRSPGATGTQLLRGCHRGPNALMLAAPASLPPPAISKHSRDHEPDLAWARRLTPGERRRAYVHAYDKRGAYLGACSSLKVGWGEPEHLSETMVGQVNFRSKNAPPGYWRACVLPALPCSFEPPLVADAERMRWYTTPTLVWAAEQGATIELEEGYVWREQHRVFEPWYRRLRDARMQLYGGRGDAATAIAYDAIKAIYTRTIGWLRSTAWDRSLDGDLYRPDWADAVVAQARTNLQRTLHRGCTEADMAPFAVYWDSLLYASDEPDPAKAAPSNLRIGPGLADYGVHASCRMADLADLLDRERETTAYELVSRMAELGRGAVPA